jgi:hypothetical protein
VLNGLFAFVIYGAKTVFPDFQVKDVLTNKALAVFSASVEDGCSAASGAFSALHFGEHFSRGLLVYSVLVKSALFAVLVVCLDIIEEIVVGLIHGKSFAASIPQLGGGGLEGTILVGILVFLVLIPLFLLTEVLKVAGKDRLRSFILHEQSKSDAA